MLESADSQIISKKHYVCFFDFKVFVVVFNQKIFLTPRINKIIVCICMYLLFFLSYTNWFFKFSKSFLEKNHGYFEQFILCLYCSFWNVK